MVLVLINLILLTENVTYCLLFFCRQYVFLTELLLYYVSCLYFSGLDVNQIYILFLGINMKMSRLLMLLQLMRAHPYRIRCMAMGRLDLSCQLEEHMTSY